MLVDSLKESVRVTEMELKEAKCTLKEVEAGTHSNKYYVPILILY